MHARCCLLDFSVVLYQGRATFCCCFYIILVRIKLFGLRYAVCLGFFQGYTVSCMLLFVVIRKCHQPHNWFLVGSFWKELLYLPLVNRKKTSYEPLICHYDVIKRIFVRIEGKLICNESSSIIWKTVKKLINHTVKKLIKMSWMISIACGKISCYAESNAHKIRHNSMVDLNVHRTKRSRIKFMDTWDKMFAIVKFLESW